MASGTEIFRLFGSILVDSSQAEASLGKTEEAAEKTQSALGKVVSGAINFAKSTEAAVTAATAAVFKVVDSVASVGDTIDKQSQKLGISAQAYQEWEAILGHCGASMDSLKAGMKTLTKAIADGSDDQVAAFQAVGLSLDQVKEMSTEDVFAAVITGLQGMEEGADRTQIATTLLGRSAQELGPLLNTSAEATEEMRQTVNDLGGVMSNEAVAASAQYKDALQDLQTVAAWFQKELVANILPYVTAGIQGLTNVMMAARSGVLQLKDAFVSGFTGIITILDKASYSMNKFLGKQAVADYGSYEEYASAKTSQKNKDARRQAALAGQGISTKSWSERQAEAEAAKAAPSAALANAGSSSGKSSSSKSSSASSAAQKTAQVIDTLTSKSQEVANGITTAIQEVTEKYDDGTEHVTKTVTASGTEIMDGVARNVKTITKYVDGVQQKVEKTVEDIDNSVSAVQTRIDKNLSEAKSKWKSGILGTFQGILSDLKSGNWGNLGLTFAKLIWGEVSQEQREIISKWASDAMTAINDSYSGGGIKAAFEQLQNLFTSGIAADATEAKTAVQSFGEILDGLGASGGVGEKLAGIATSFSSMSGSVISSLGGIVSFITANPILAAILGITALAGGIGLAALSKKSKGSDSVTGGSYDSPFSKTPIYDSLKEFSARADSLSRYSTATVSPFSGQQDSTGKQQLSVLQRISNSLDEHLPAIGTGQVVFDTGAVAGALRPALVDGIDTDLGTRAQRKARGG